MRDREKESEGERHTQKEIEREKKREGVGGPCQPFCCWSRLTIMHTYGAIKF